MLLVLLGASPLRAETASPSGTPSGASALLRHGILVGVDYYPEHWPADRWEVDLKLMHDAGFNVVRLAEFSWAKMEPAEGDFDFEWLDHILELCQKYEIHVILGTPTAVMPAWLAHKYPTALALKADGTRTVWGGRRHNCFSDEDFARLGERITSKMAARYADHPAVIGWQIDNELGGADCRCDKCRVGFQAWLKQKYGTLAELNRAWGTHFWALTIGDWAEIPIPDDRTGDWAISNPSASLDWLRFGSALNVNFLNQHARLLRDHIPAAQFVTHNLMGLHAGLNYFDLAENLDFVSWDNYPTLSPKIPYNSSLAADVMRGLKGQNFLIMEQTAGPLGWAVFSRNPQPGELRKICYQQLAHGADGQVWFRWRTCTVGREQYWHGLLGHDGKTGRRYAEAAQVAREYQKLAPFLAGTTVQADIAIVYDYDSIWALQIQGGYPGASQQAAIKRYYNALLRAGVNVDIVRSTANLAKYKLVLAPHLHVLSDEVADKLTEYVRSGGVLLTDCRTGVKDVTNLAHARTLPGLLAPALGIEIDEYESLRLGIEGPDETTYALRSEPIPGNFTAISYADWIKPTTAKAIAAYDEPHLREFAAITRNDFGDGVAWYLGTIVKEDEFYDALITKLLSDATIKPLAAPPRGVEISLRSSPTNSLLFLVNHTDQSHTVAIAAGGGVDLLTNVPTSNHIDLTPFGVAVIDVRSIVSPSAP